VVVHAEEEENGRKGSGTVRCEGEEKKTEEMNLGQPVLTPKWLNYKNT